MNYIHLMIEVVKKAAVRAGGVTSLAKALGVRHTSFYSWRRVPAERVRAIEAATGIPAHELRPDIFPPPEQKRAS